MAATVSIEDRPTRQEAPVGLNRRCSAPPAEEPAAADLILELMVMVSTPVNKTEAMNRMEGASHSGNGIAPLPLSLLWLSGGLLIEV